MSSASHSLVFTLADFSMSGHSYWFHNDTLSGPLLPSWPLLLSLPYGASKGADVFKVDSSSSVPLSLGRLAHQEDGPTLWNGCSFALLSTRLGSQIDAPATGSFSEMHQTQGHGAELCCSLCSRTPTAENSMQLSSHPARGLSIIPGARPTTPN